MDNVFDDVSVDAPDLSDGVSDDALDDVSSSGFLDVSDAAPAAFVGEVLASLLSPSPPVSPAAVVSLPCEGLAPVGGVTPVGVCTQQWRSKILGSRIRSRHSHYCISKHIATADDTLDTPRRGKKPPIKTS